MLNLPFEKVARHFRLDQVIDACAAAAPGALGKFDEFEMGIARKRVRGWAVIFWPWQR